MRFLFFRLPGEQQINKIEHKDGLKNIASFFPFDTERKEVNLSSEKIEKVVENEISSLLRGIDFPTQKEKIDFPTQEEYLQKIEKAKQIVEQNGWKKLVISRPKNILGKIDLEKTFLNLCGQFPYSFCYFWKDEEQIWIGATPELLGRFNKHTLVFETMSLAGTLLIEESWTDKEIEEQNAVTQYIHNILSSFSSNINISETYEHIVGKIKHLRTDFSLKIQPQNLNYLIQTLHPTPAVCGIPKDDCKKEILAIEGYNRAFYSGYIRVETPDDVYFFVNLRCMQIFDAEMIVYVGGGVTNKSNAMKEWQETELKSQTIIDHLKFI